VAPPYDVISPEEQDALHRRHPKNITWVDFGMAKEGDGPGVNKYTAPPRGFENGSPRGPWSATPSPPSTTTSRSSRSREEDLRAEGVPRALKLSAFGEGEVFPTSGRCPSRRRTGSP